MCEFVASPHRWLPCVWLWPQVPHQPFHPDNKEPPAACTGGLLNEISYQSANSCGLCLAVRSGYESPSAALNSYHLDVYLLGGIWQARSPALFKVSLSVWFVAAEGGTAAIKKTLIYMPLISGWQLSHFIFTDGIWSWTANNLWPNYARFN